MRAPIRLPPKRTGILDLTPVEFNAQSKARLAQVNPALAELMLRVEAQHPDAFEITEGMRDPLRQAQMVAEGKSQTLNSRHLTGNAVDIALMGPDGQPNWNFEDYQPIAATAKAAAASLGIPDFVWGGDWKTLRDGVHFQVGGPQQGGAANNLTVSSKGGTGMGLLDMPAQQPQTFGQRLGQDFRSGELMDRLAVAFNSMRMNPDQGIGALVENRQARRETAAQRNATVEWLRSRGQDDLAAALEAGAPPQEVLAESVRRMQPAAQPEPTALMQNVQWLMSQGIPMDRAIEMTRGGTTVNVGGEGQPTPQLLGTSGLVAIPDPSIPQGYRVEPAPGSPLALEAENARREAARVEEKAATGAERKEIYKSEVVRAAEKAKELMSKKGVTDILPEAGVFGSMLARSPIPLPGSQEATDLKVTLEAVQSGVAFDRLQAMRDASVTGGALGAVTERELALLMNSLGAISQEASPELLRENLDNIIRIMTKIENDPVAGRAYNTGQVGSGTTGAQIPQNGPVRITNDAEYEALPSGTAFISPDGKLRRKP